MAGSIRARGWRTWRPALAFVCVCLLIAAGLLDPPRRRGATAPLRPAVGARAGRFPHWNRVAVLILENREYPAVIGSPRGRYLTTLARRYGLATRYYALAHPSLPNYLALTAGSTFGVHRDCNRCDLEAPSPRATADARRGGN
jgi:hypothetical protein